MQETVASIKANGVMVPGLARPEKDGNGYEIVAGHRRHHGCELAGLGEPPLHRPGVTDHEAVQAMKDSNKQRDQTLPSGLAALLELGSGGHQAPGRAAEKCGRGRYWKTLR